MLQAIIAYMPVVDTNASIGSINYSRDEKVRLAKESVNFNCEQCGPIEAICKKMIETEEKDEEVKEKKEAKAENDNSNKESCAKKDECPEVKKEAKVEADLDKKSEKKEDTHQNNNNERQNVRERPNRAAREQTRLNRKGTLSAGTKARIKTVSYTHLTLPTICSV
eukprot:TRINITY_DN5260_c0_g5_i1.p1 TRINITY_DN5260_c0_g5~~TRINITY_DN5260_c0_g5_i1.p1  ORF type:complete len:166 (-),score=57.74 TRINITY_DN5260_c0_g5_i1:47-544(-)